MCPKTDRLRLRKKTNNNMNRISQLIYKYIIDDIREDERVELGQWLQDQKNRELFDRLTNPETFEKEIFMRESINTERPLRDMQSRLGYDITPHENRTHTIWSLRRWVSAAAILLLVIGVGYQSYKYGIGQINKTSDKEIALSSPITHGQTKAVLTLNNGERIELGADTKRNEHIIKKILSDAEMIQEKEGQKQRISLKTPRGGEFKITLEDGTEVWLNAESQLQYPESFDTSERRVAVSGEAYFKVAKDAARPFYVETAGQLVRVYGTEFNINSYQEDTNVYTTLVNGRISLSPLNGNGSELMLTPGHQAVFDKQDVSSSVRTVDTSIVTSWRNGKFVFENQTLEQIMITLSRWYDFDYEFKDIRLRNTIFMGSVPRYGEFSEVLSILEKSGGISFTQNGKTIIINHK